MNHSIRINWFSFGHHHILLDFRNLIHQPVCFRTASSITSSRTVTPPILTERRILEKPGTIRVLICFWIFGAFFRKTSSGASGITRRNSSLFSVPDCLFSVWTDGSLSPLSVAPHTHVMYHSRFKIIQIYNCHTGRSFFSFQSFLIISSIVRACPGINVKILVISVQFSNQFFTLHMRPERSSSFSFTSSITYAFPSISI